MQEFKNSGVDTVQMLSRHWIFGDAEGRTNEVKGPGAVGATPILRPGESWSYDSGTSIQTRTGSVEGSFQFEVLKDVSGIGAANFNAPVARLALTEERRPVRVPCAEEADIAAGFVPTTSVHSTQRVIIGATSEFQPSPAEAAGLGAQELFTFSWDIQINNAREDAVRVRDTYWQIIDADGRMATHRGAPPSAEPPAIAPGGAYRGPYTRGTFHLTTRTGNARGFMTVEAVKSGVEPPTCWPECRRVGDLLKQGITELLPRVEVRLALKLRCSRILCIRLWTNA